MIIESDLVELNLKAKDRAEAIKFLSDKLLAKEIVKPSFYKAVMKREKEFPTGLQGKYTNFALSHADIEHVNEAAMAVAVLDEPIEYPRMDDPNKLIDIEILIVFTVVEPSKQVTVLQDFLNLMQDQELVNQLLDAESKSEVVNLLSNNLEF